MLYPHGEGKGCFTSSISDRNKNFVIDAFEAVNRGDASAFGNACSEVVENFLDPFLAEVKDGKIVFIFDKLSAESNFLCCQCRGDATTIIGNRYHNEYCYIPIFNDAGQITEFVEFNNSALVNTAFGR